MADRRKPQLKLEANDSTLRAARVATPTANQRDAKLAWSRLVSGSIALHFEFFLAKSGGKTALDRLYRSVVAWFTPAAFKPRASRVIAGFGRLGESYVAVRASLREPRLGGC